MSVDFAGTKVAALLGLVPIYKRSWRRSILCGHKIDSRVSKGSAWATRRHGLIGNAAVNVCIKESTPCQALVTRLGNAGPTSLAEKDAGAAQPRFVARPSLLIQDRLCLFPFAANDVRLVICKTKKFTKW